MSLSLVCFLDHECSMYLAFLFHPCVLRVLHSSTSCIRWFSLSPSLFTLTPGLATSLGPLLLFHYKWNQKTTFQGLAMLIPAPELFSAGNLLCVYLYIGVPTTWLTSKHQAKSWLLVFPFYWSLHNPLHSQAWHGKSTSVAILLYNMAGLVFLRKWCNLEKLAQEYTRIWRVSWRMFCVCRMGRRDNVFKQVRRQIAQGLIWLRDREEPVSVELLLREKTGFLFCELKRSYRRTLIGRNIIWFTFRKCFCERLNWNAWRAVEAIVEGWVVVAGTKVVVSGGLEEKTLWETFREVVGWISCWIDHTVGNITSSV